MVDLSFCTQTELWRIKRFTQIILQESKWIRAALHEFLTLCMHGEMKNIALVTAENVQLSMDVQM